MRIERDAGANAIAAKLAMKKTPQPQPSVEVGSFSPNTFGLHDMHGNVWEWVEDCYRESYLSAPSDGRSTSEVAKCSRVLRGGSWTSNPVILRAAFRASTQ